MTDKIGPILRSLMTTHQEHAIDKFIGDRSPLKVAHSACGLAWVQFFDGVRHYFDESGRALPHHEALVIKAAYRPARGRLGGQR